MATASITSTGGAGNDLIVSGIPVAPRNVGTPVTIGDFTYTRAGTGNYTGSVIATGATQVKFASDSTTGGGFLGNVSGPSFAASSQDLFSLHCIFETT